MPVEKSLFKRASAVGQAAWYPISGFVVSATFSQSEVAKKNQGSLEQWMSLLKMKS